MPIGEFVSHAETDRAPMTSHTHHFIPGTDLAKPPLVLLHGSCGNEHELVPLAGDLARRSPILAVRGGIPFDGGYPFFHRFPDRSIDEADIASRAAILADFIGAASMQYSLTRAPIACFLQLVRSWQRPCS
jgi:phospholipase/carboxylesterase